MLRSFVNAALMAALLGVVSPGRKLTAQVCFSSAAPVLQSDCAANIDSPPCGLGKSAHFVVLDYLTGAPYTLPACETGFSWDFGDGATATGMTAQHAFAQSGRYTVAARSTPIGMVNLSIIVFAANGLVTMSPANPNVTESDGYAVVNVHTTYSPATVSYLAYDAGNMSGRFTPITGTLSFGPGESDKPVAIPLLNDSFYEGPGALGLQLSNPTNVLFKTSVFPTADPVTYSFAVADDDPPPTLAWSSSKYVYSEAAGQGALSVVRTGDMRGTVSVTYWLRLSTNSFGTLTFAPGETSKTIPFPIPNDNAWDFDRHWEAQLLNVTSPGIIGNPPNTSFGTVQIVINEDDPIPAISISDASIAELNAGKQTFPLVISVSSKVPYSFIAKLSYGGLATPTVDYLAPSSVTFNPGELEKTVPITVIGDTQVEPNETVAVTISGITATWGETMPAPVIAKATGTLTIVNDDFAMRELRLPEGTSGRMQISLGNPTSNEDVVMLTSSRPDVAKVPSSFVASKGRSTLDFDVQALSPGTALVTATFPASLGGMSLSANVEVGPSATGVVITQIAPSNGFAAGGTEATISGLNFAPSCTVTFGNSLATTVFESPSALHVATPPHAPGMADVTITCGVDQFTLPNGFSFFTPARSRGVRH